MKKMLSWQMFEPGVPFKLIEKSLPELNKGEVLVKISGCGVCHTDLGFYYGGVNTKSSKPLTLGHEISGIVIEASDDFSHLNGEAVIVPAVLSCGVCDVCVRGLGNICPNQKMLGNDIDGGFSTHLIVNGKQLCKVPVDKNYNPISKADVSLKELSVVADAITTPYQAIVDSGLTSDDTAIFVGVGGVGGFGAQIAKSFGALVIVIDIDQDRLNLLEPYVDLTFNSTLMSFKELRKEITEFVKKNGRRRTEWKIFETSGTVSGQKTAYGLLTYGSCLSIVGFTMEKLNIRLSNLMAFHSVAKGNWGCLTKYYSSVMDLVLKGSIKIKPFVDFSSLSEINSVFKKIHNKESISRVILVP